jgi:hypothetical protein
MYVVVLVVLVQQMFLSASAWQQLCCRLLFCLVEAGFKPALCLAQCMLWHRAYVLPRGKRCEITAALDKNTSSIQWDVPTLLLMLAKHLSLCYAVALLPLTLGRATWCW